MKTLINPQSQLITIHLNEDNYLLWKFQVETAIYGYGLEGFVLETLPIPSKFVTEIPLWSNDWNHQASSEATNAHDSPPPHSVGNEPLEPPNPGFTSLSTNQQLISQSSIPVNQNIENADSQSTNNQRNIPADDPPTQDEHPMITRLKSEIFKPKVYTTTSNSTEPVSFEQTVKSK